MGVYTRRRGSEGRHWEHKKVALLALVVIQQRTVAEAQISTRVGFLGLGHFRHDSDLKKGSWFIRIPNIGSVIAPLAKRRAGIVDGTMIRMSRLPSLIVPGR